MSTSASASACGVVDARPLIAVFGATGHQGGAVFRSLTASNEFRVRGLSRDPQSDAAKKLLADTHHKSASGDVDVEVEVEVVFANPADSESLVKALNGAWGAFVVTHFFDPKVPDWDEEKFVKNIADQAVKSGVKFFLYSGLPDAASLSSGRHPVPFFTKKHKAEQYIRSLAFADGVAFPYAGSFASNYLDSYMSPKKNAKDGVYELSGIVRNDVALPIVDIEEEYGSTVLEIFRHPKKYTGQVIITGEYITLPQFAEAFSKGTGKACRYVQLPLEAGKHMPPAVNDFFQYINSFGYYGGVAIHHIENAKKTDAVAFWKRHAAQF